MKSQNMPGKPAINATLERKGLEIGFKMLANFEVGALIKTVLVYYKYHYRSCTSALRRSSLQVLIIAGIDTLILKG